MVLLRLLDRHPDVSEIIAVSHSQAGRPAHEVDPGLHPLGVGRMRGTQGRLVTAEQALDCRPDVVFSALPHLESSRACAPFAPSSVIIDLSADLRFSDRGAFSRVYGTEVPEPGLAEKAVYGLVEWRRKDIVGARVIANPGCYPTVCLLPLLPLAARGLIEGTIVINAASGVSGAGRKLAANYLFAERSESYGAYSPGTSHRHLPEIREKLTEASGGTEQDVLFTPHLVPMRRGIAVTIVTGLRAGLSAASVTGALGEAYGDCTFVCLRGESIPQTGDVWGSNRCDIGWRLEGRHLMLFSVIDNLVKGASGQAVQNMNVCLGLPEAAGLEANGVL